MCKQKVALNPKVACGTPGAVRSADFALDCKADTQTIEVEVPCQDEWVNVPASKNMLSHNDFCAAVGMEPTEIDGYDCASGTHFPQSGLNADAIRYPYGRDVDDLDTYRGGNAVSQPKDYTAGKRFFCYVPSNGRQYRDLDIVVAYACKS